MTENIKIVNINADGTETEELIPADQYYNQMSEEDREKYWAKHVRMEISDYARQRALRYPNIGDQLDDLFKQGLFSDEMSAKIQAVKDNIPKPTE